MTHRTFILVAIVITLLASGKALAQTNKTQQPTQQSDWDDNDTEKPVRFNVVVDDPMDKFGPQSTLQATSTYFTVPEFYFPLPKKLKDTTYKFLCYDSRDTLMPDVTNYDQVYYYSLFKEYDDPIHTYTDNGIKKPLPVSFIVRRYDRIAPDKWMSVEYPGNKYSELKGNRNIVVRTDTIGTLRIYKYYRVTKN